VRYGLYHRIFQNPLLDEQIRPVFNPDNFGTQNLAGLSVEERTYIAQALGVNLTRVNELIATTPLYGFNKNSHAGLWFQERLPALSNIYSYVLLDKKFTIPLEELREITLLLDYDDIFKDLETFHDFLDDLELWKQLGQSREALDYLIK